MPPWNSTKTKVQLRIAVQRLRNLQEKKEAQAKVARRDIAMLLEQRKVEKARVKVETIINDDIHIELLELLELYCELLIARFGLVDQNSREPDPGVSEGICCIIYAAPHTELKELHILRDMLMHKYGRDFSIGVMENRDKCVSERVLKKLTFATPSQELVDGYLEEIAKGYGINWSLGPKNDDSSVGGGGDGGQKEQESIGDSSDPPSYVADKIAEDTKMPKLPDIPPTEDSKPAVLKTAPATTSTTTVKGPVSSAAPANKDVEDEFAELARRFEALKRK